MSDERLENSKDKKTYFLRTQSSILRGEQNIPLNTLLSTYRNTTSVSKGKNKKFQVSTEKKIKIQICF